MRFPIFFAQIDGAVVRLKCVLPPLCRLVGSSGGCTGPPTASLWRPCAVCPNVFKWWITFHTPRITIQRTPEMKVRGDGFPSQHLLSRNSHEMHPSLQSYIIFFILKSVPKPRLFWAFLSSGGGGFPDPPCAVCLNQRVPIF